MKKFTLQLLKSTFLVLTILIFQGVSIFALSPEQKKLYQGGIKYFNWTEECSTGTTATAAVSSGGALKSGDKVYILGDSITHGASAKYTELFSSKQITPTISAVTSRSWNGAGTPGAGATGTQGSGKDAIITDEAKVKESAAVIIALGTNGLEGSNPIDDVIAKVNEIKSGVKIYWVNVAGTKVPGDLAPFNKALADKASGKYTVIDWAKAVDPSGDGKNDPNSLLADGVHPNTNGYQKLADLVVNATTTGSSAISASTSTPLNDNNSSSTSCCSSGSPTLKAATAPSDNIDLEYEDPARSNRKVGVTIWAPQGDASPKPLVVFAPGRGQNSKKDSFYKRYLQAIASKGFIVAGMNFSDNNSYEAAAKGAEDVKFVIDKLLQEEKVKSKVDPATGVGVVGHSDGGFISLMNGYAEGKKHDRVSAVIAANGAVYGGVKNVAGPPLLIMHGTSDTTQNISSSDAAYASIQAPYSSFAKFKGADHDKYITQESSQSKDAVDEITGAFLRRWLTKDSGDATDLKKIAETKYADKIEFAEKGDNKVTGNNSASSAPVAATSASCACTVGGAGLNGADGEAQTWNFLIAKGLTPIQTAGAVGNMEHEGGFKPKQLEIAYSDPPHIWESPDSMPAVRGPQGQPGYGIVQWTTVDRKNNLLNYAKSKGKPIHDMLTQLEFMWSELEGSYYKSRALDPLRAATDLAEATRIWQEKYEVGAGFDPRFKSAKAMLAKYGSSAAAPTSTATATTPTGGGCGDGGGGAQGPTGGTFSWPMEPAKSVISQCFTGAGGHPGIDIFVGQSDGPPIFAAADGIVTKAGPAGGYGPNFVVIQHPNNYGSSYGHMSKISVKQGDTVKQGQQIGEQGNLGISSGAHLHFNIFPGTYVGWDSKNVNPLSVGLTIPPGVKNSPGCK